MAGDSMLPNSVQQPLLGAQALTSVAQDEAIPPSKSCPVSGETSGTCPIEAFQLPENGFKNHPGGQHHLKTAKESDCSGLMFLTYHLGYDIDGRIATSAKALGIKMPERGLFFDEVHTLLCRIKQEHKAQHYIFVAWCLTVTVCLLVSLVAFMHSISYFWGTCLGLLFEVYFLSIFHTRHHKGGKLYDITFLDCVTAPLYEFIDNTWGYNPNGWWKNHHMLHHMHTNETDGCEDPDLPAMYPLVRLFSRQDRHWFHLMQTFYFPLLLPFSVARFPVQNILLHGGSKLYFAVWLFIMFGNPVLRLGMEGLAVSLFVQSLVGVLLTYKFAVSHSHFDLVTHSDIKSELRNTNGQMQVDAWMANQIEESSNWGGYVSTLIFGGINLQIEHHLAPALDPPLLWFFAQELQPICKKHGIQYVREPTLLHAVFKMHVRLWNMGQSPAPETGAS